MGGRADDIVQMTARVPRSLRARVKAMAAYRGLDMRDYIAEVLDEAVTRHEAERHRSSG